MKGEIPPINEGEVTYPTAPEVAPVPERPILKKEFVGAHVRLLMAGDALNPSYSVGVLSKESLGFNEGIDSQIEGHDYSSFAQSSHKERMRQWDNEKNFEVQKKEWSDQVLQRFESSRAFFTSSEKGEQWAQALSRIGVKAEQFNQDQLDSVYQKYCSGNSEQQVKQLVKDIILSYMQNGVMNRGQLEQDLETFEWFSGILGSMSSKVLKQMVVAEVNLHEDPDDSIRLAYEKTNDVARVNNLTNDEKKLLSFLSPDREVSSSIDPGLDADSSVAITELVPGNSGSVHSTLPLTDTRIGGEIINSVAHLRQDSDSRAANDQKWLIAMFSASQRQELSAEEREDNIRKIAQAAFEAGVPGRKINAQLASVRMAPEFPDIDNKNLSSEIISTMEGVNKDQLTQEIMDQLKDGQETDEYVKKILESPYEDLKPVNRTEVEGQIFYFSKVMDDGDRQIALAYTQRDGKFVPRFFYRSKSAGGWRSSPGIEKNGRFKKGGNFEGDPIRYHYVQVTKPTEEIIHVLDEISNNPSLRSRNGDARSKAEEYMEVDVLPKEVQTFDEETHVFMEKLYSPPSKLGELVMFPPGKYDKETIGENGKYMQEYKERYGKEPGGLAEVFRSWNADFFNSEEMKGFLPDFTVPDREFTEQHSLLGGVTMRTFRTTWQGRPIEWIMANDNVGRIWIDNIVLIDSPVNSYGVKSEFINAGALTNKPLEYDMQARGLKYGEEKMFYSNDSTYDDITLLLDDLYPIGQYRKQYKIDRDPSIDPSELMRKAA